MSHSMTKIDLTQEKKKQFAGLYLLERMINRPETFPIFLEKHDKDLEPILEYLLTFEYINIEEKKKYVPTIKGRDVIEKFLARYRDFLRNFDVYSAVDLTAGTFAFAEYWNIKSEEEWKEFLSQGHWEDLRVAVAEFKKIDPIEIVFMSFLYEDRFGWSEESGWQFDLLLGSVWDKILDIVNTALKVGDLGYKDHNEFIDGKSIIKDIIIQGAELNEKLWRDEDDRDFDIDHGEDNNPPNDNYYHVPPIENEKMDARGYRLHKDPYYTNPCWSLMFFI